MGVGVDCSIVAMEFGLRGVGLLGVIIEYSRFRTYLASGRTNRYIHKWITLGLRYLLSLIALLEFRIAKYL